MTGRILIGTSSWTDPTLVKGRTLLPARREERRRSAPLLRVAVLLVEVDSTYYFPPSEKNSVLWIERTPPEFTFNIKAYSLLTNHPTKRGRSTRTCRSRRRPTSATSTGISSPTKSSTKCGNGSATR